MLFDEIFPNWKVALRNALAVGGIVLASSGLTSYPPSLETIYTAIVGFSLAVIVEFCNTYKQVSNGKTNPGKIVSFFLA